MWSTGCFCITLLFLSLTLQDQSGLDSFLFRMVVLRMFKLKVFVYCLMEEDLHFIRTYCLFDYFLVNYHRQRALYSLHRFRDVGRPFETHNSLTTSWPGLSYPILPVTGFTYCHMLDDFVRSADSERQPLYIHGTATLPFSVISSQTACSMIYRMFLFNTPYVVFTEFCSIN